MSLASPAWRTAVQCSAVQCSAVQCRGPGRHKNLCSLPVDVVSKRTCARDRATRARARSGRFTVAAARRLKIPRRGASTQPTVVTVGRNRWCSGRPFRASAFASGLAARPSDLDAATASWAPRNQGVPASPDRLRRAKTGAWLPARGTMARSFAWAITTERSHSLYSAEAWPRRANQPPYGSAQQDHPQH